MSQKNPMTPPGIDRGTVRIVVQRLNHYATPGPTSNILGEINHKSSTHILVHDHELLADLHGIHVGNELRSQFSKAMG